MIEPIDSRVVADVLRDVPAELIPAIEASLKAAWRDTQETLGNDPSIWRWGDLHQIRFTHPLLARAPADLAAAMQYHPLPRGGSADTPNNTGYANAKDFDVATGASFRIVVDVGNWDAARMTNAPGQSGDPRSPFYRNLLAGWANDESYPLVYSQAAIAEHTVLTIRLTPQPALEGKE